MLYWATAFSIVAFLAAIVAFSGLFPAAALVAKICLIACVVMTLASLVLAIGERR